MADEKTTFEIALRDSISPQLKAIARELKGLNALRSDSDQSGTGTVDKFHRSTTGLGSTARVVTKDLAGIGSWVVGVGGGLLGGLGAIATIKAVATSLSNMAESRVQMTMFSRDTRFAVEDIEKLRGAMSRMGMSADRADALVAGLSGKLQELQAFKEGSPLFQQLAKMGEGGVSLANELINEKDYMKSLQKISETFKRQGPEAQAYMVSVLGVPASVLENLDANLRKVRNAPNIDPKVAQQFLDNQKDVSERLNNEWTLFGEHALGRINDFYAKLEKKTGEAHPLSHWAIAIFDEFDKTLQTDLQDATAIYHGYLATEAFFKKVNDKTGITYLAEKLGVPGHQKNRWDQAFGDLEQQKLSKDNNSLLGDISKSLHKMFDMSAGASTMPGGAGSAYPGDTSAAPTTGAVPQSLQQPSSPPPPGPPGSPPAAPNTGTATPPAPAQTSDVKVDDSVEGRKAGLKAATSEMEAAGLTVTSSYRSPDDPLSKANPHSAHSQGLAFDTRAHTAEESDAAQAKIRATMAARGLQEGRDYKILDEVRHPSGWATGPHVHTQFTPEGMTRYQQGIVTANAAGAKTANAAVALPPGTAAPTSTSAPGKNPDGSDLPPRVQAVGGADPAAFITHHTSGRGTIAGVQETLRQRGLGVEYAMDRDGNVRQIGGPGSANIKTSWGPLGGGGSERQPGGKFSNQNIVGMEIIAKDDKDVTPAQAAAYAKFMAARYPDTPIFGHGEINPGHKEADEGLTAKRTAEDYRAKLAGGGDADKARANIDKDNDVWKKGTNAVKFSFNNVPSGVKTNAEASGSFTQVEVSRKSAMAERAAD
jgi:hypothetical protein